MSSKFLQDVDETELARARRGDMRAHESLYRKFAPPVYTLARRLVRRDDVAEEILQETFLDVMRRIHGFRNEAPLGMWIRRIAVNRCLMFLRSYWEQFSQPLGEEGEIAAAAPGEPGLAKFDLDRLLGQLPPMSRAVIWLHDVEGYTHEEIGSMLGKTASFSKSQLARSHARLQALTNAAPANAQEVKHAPGTF